MNPAVYATALANFPNILSHHVGTDAAFNTKAWISSFYFCQNLTFTHFIETDQRRVSYGKRVIFVDFAHVVILRLLSAYWAVKIIVVISDIAGSLKTVWIEE